MNDKHLLAQVAPKWRRLFRDTTHVDTGCQGNIRWEMSTRPVLEDNIVWQLRADMYTNEFRGMPGIWLYVTSKAEEKQEVAKAERKNRRRKHPVAEEGCLRSSAIYLTLDQLNARGYVCRLVADLNKRMGAAHKANDRWIGLRWSLGPSLLLKWRLRSAWRKEADFLISGHKDPYVEMARIQTDWIRRL